MLQRRVTTEGATTAITATATTAGESSASVLLLRARLLDDKLNILIYC